MRDEKELAVIQQTYDLIRWYVPLLNKLPRDHRFNLGDRIIGRLYDLLEELIEAKYIRQKLPVLARINRRLEVLRFQTRLLSDFGLIDGRKYGHAAARINEIGAQVGGWIKSQRGQPS